MKLSLLGRNDDYPSLLQRAADVAKAGRQLALYDPETGLFAAWFFRMRCQDECYRAVRYGRPLTLLLIEVRNNGDDFLSAVGYVLGDLRAGRRTDVPSQLGAGRFAVLLPETDTAGAEALASRLEALAPGVFTVVASHPGDGGNQEQLLACAQQRMDTEIASRPESPSGPEG